MKLLVKEVQSVLHIDDDNQVISWTPMSSGWDEEFSGEAFVINSECWISATKASPAMQVLTVDFPHYSFKDNDGWDCVEYKSIPFLIEVKNGSKWDTFKVEL